jgi:hypothetical protein
VIHTCVAQNATRNNIRYRSYNLIEQDTLWEIQLEANNVSGSGWLGIGWSSDGRMQVRQHGG